MGLNEFSQNKKGSATQQCPLGKGMICVIATRCDTKKPLSDVKASVEGPTPGQGATSAQGIRQFEARDPGVYQLNVSFAAPRYREWDVLPYSKELSVSAGYVTVIEVQACPTGTLVVEIREEAGPFIQGSADVQASGASSLSQLIEGGKHTFAKVHCGEYDVSARLSEKYHKQSVSAPKVRVPESGIGVARLVVRPRTWIEIELIDEDGTPVADEEYAIVTPDGQRLTGKTDAKGQARHEGLVPGQCMVSFPSRDKEEWSRV
jgi:hypothetical protein